MKIVSGWLDVEANTDMAWVEYVKGDPKGMKTQICKSCREGKHMSYGSHHLPTNFKVELQKVKNNPEDLEEYIYDVGRYSCKNVGMLDGKQVQCMCSASSLAEGTLTLPF